MSLEQALAANTEALNKQNELLAKLLERGGGVTGAASTAAASTAAASTGKPAKPAKTDTKPKGPTVEDMQAALTKVKEQFSATDAKEIIKEFGGVAKMAEIPADKVKDVFEACQAKLNPPEQSEEEGDGL